MEVMDERQRDEFYEKYKPTKIWGLRTDVRFLAGHLDGLVVIAPARRAGDPGSNPGPGENFSLKLLIVLHYLEAEYSINSYILN